ncbi:hypothetical protein K437DRAFT_259162 [Tilletiaria anomala UBC 951]|uniref:UBC core domain-containing protein n=1 Tax=Tilletiaria anomala (strain ATCC 24038 / CBS 436.72 / UBC 951) TaxID=1037660 RepID=A0A066VFS7_TILAU|nr:uncharacterized protein K437DRAFT_259162 [Tilletiaria anomala UBC 951]KDN39158.1 hypothetical protein K437DRAFT_259162 [Tilletiaria anomala UBC 951]
MAFPSARRVSTSQSALSPATTRRLMKEWQSILESNFNSSRSKTSERRDAALPRRTISASRPSSAQEDLLELRPWDADGEDLYEWYARIRGPNSGSYSGGEFDLSIQIPPSYPTKPPKMWFRTRIWHPNVHFKTGEICLDLLSSQWSPAWTLSSLCTAIIALLDSPEPSSPLNVDAANVLRAEDEVAYRSMCKMYTRLFASPVAQVEARKGER